MTEAKDFDAPQVAEFGGKCGGFLPISTPPHTNHIVTPSHLHPGTYSDPHSSTSVTNSSALGESKEQEEVEAVNPTEDEMEKERLVAKAEQVWKGGREGEREGGRKGKRGKG